MVVRVSTNQELTKYIEELKSTILKVERERDVLVFALDRIRRQMPVDTLDDIETYPEGCDNYGSLDND